ncbi:MAG: OadG family protein [Treponema sp.]|jgi:oxaloacetate decarboxylase gamma subunit|nr:OadG family protein [Treponema sp.]
MTILEMLEQSAILTLLGMAVVFAFLWLMIVCVNLTRSFIHRMGWDRDIEGQQNEFPKGAGKTADPTTAAAISAALTEYRKGQQGGRE